ncbi:MAG: glycine cleavage system aminomethyltransferase GcvT [Candidatus Margulisbacteria bacterium]|nr:glycine cleavage system aminomethyltransferase GcvT [Candidatus Margulisiibacteriota bacterium]
MKKTALNEEHKKLKAKMVDFAGWEMPIQYTGIIHEHKAVRELAGVFDVSHMCVLDVRGDSAFDFLQYVTINDVAKLKIYGAQYSMVLDKEGQILDDIIVSRMDGYFRLVLNSSNADKIKKWFELMKKENNYDITLNYREDLSILALQGPKSQQILEEILGVKISLNSFYFMKTNWQGEDIAVSRTGYTGELGYEIFISNQLAPLLWQKIINKGVTPAGLGARDTLRIEAGLPLYGKEIVADITAYDLGYSWIVSLLKGEFLGKTKLVTATKDKRLYGCILEDKGVLRDGYEVLGHGKITSGTFSPTLGTAIGMFYSEKKPKENEGISVVIRGKEFKGRVINLPFLKKKINK